MADKKITALTSIGTTIYAAYLIHLMNKLDGIDFEMFFFFPRL